jgi:hypothetical protein
MNKFIIVISAVFVMMMFIATAALVSQGSKNDVAADLVAACPKTYENDLLEFQYPCNWLLTGNIEDRRLTFTEFYSASFTPERYFLIEVATDGFSDFKSEKPSECESGEYYIERKMTITTVDGQELEACYHGEHEGETLTIHSDRFETGYISISSENSLESVIIPSLKVK